MVTKQKREIMDGLVAYIDRFVPGLNETVRLYQSGDTDGARKLTVDLVEGLGWIVEGIGVLQPEVRVDFDGVTEVFEELEEALSHGDDVLTADIFEHEILPLITTWRAALRTAQTDAAPQPGDP